MALSRLSLLLLVSSLTSCGPAASEGGFDSANSAARMYAIEYAARDGDRTAIPRLVEQLNADDEAVRALAIASLERLTGQTKGYRDFDPIEIRRDAVARWAQAIHAGEFDPRGEGEPRMNTDEHGLGVGREDPDETGKAPGTTSTSLVPINFTTLDSPIIRQVVTHRPGFSIPQLHSSVFIRVHPWFPFSPLSRWPSVTLRVPTSLPESHRG